jgi:hypothetical protein
MGIGKKIKKALKPAAILGSVGIGGDNFLGTSRNVFGGKGGISANIFENKKNPDGTAFVPTEQDITTANLFESLSPEQKKDLLLNNPNIYTPQGSQTYDPLTNSVNLKESDFTKAERLRQEGLAGQLSGSLDANFNDTRFGGNSEQIQNSVQNSIFDRGKAQIDPIVKQQKRDLAQQLADQGVPAGSEQYNEAMNRMDDAVARQYTDLSQASVGTGFSAGQQAIQTSETIRNSRFNEISSLLGRSQVGAGTSFGGYQPNYNGIDLAGFAQQQSLQSQQLSFQAGQNRKDRNANRTNALIGAVGSLGSAGIKASDITLKENIRQTGVSPSGIVIYEFDYKDKSHGEGRYSGVMAQDLLESHPSAVIKNNDGTLKVDYSQIDVEFRRIK